MENNRVDNNAWSGLLLPIAVGMILQAISLGFLLLQFILPSVGLVLIYVGVREFRLVNRWFRIAWGASLCALLAWAMLMVLMATPLAVSVENPGILTPIGLFGLLRALCLAGLLFAVWKGIRVFFHEKGTPQSAGEIIGSLVWIVCINLIGFLYFQNGGIEGNWIVALFIFIVYIVLGVAMSQLGNALDKTELIPTYSPVRLSGTLWGTGYLLGILVMIACVGIFVNHPIVLGEKIQFSAEEGIRAELVAKGMPKEAAAVLSNEAADYLKDATTFQVQEEMLKYKNQSAMYVATIFVKTSDKTAYALEYFRWKYSKAYWDDGFVLWGDGTVKYLDGKLAYDTKGVTHFSNLLQAGEPIERWDSNGVNKTAGITAGVSYPFGTQEHRGYVLVEFSNKEWQPGYILFDYCHFNTPLRFPFDYPKNLLQNQRVDFLQHYATFFE
jgi:hypothetical protein